MFKTTLHPVGCLGDKFIDIAGSMTIAEMLGIRTEVHWIILDPSHRYCYSPAFISVIDPNIKVVTRYGGPESKSYTMEFAESGMCSPSIVKSALDQLVIDNDFSIPIITSKWLQNLRKIVPSEIITDAMQTCIDKIDGSIGIHLSHEFNQENRSKLERYICDMISPRSGTLHFFICCKDKSIKKNFTDWLSQKHPRICCEVLDGCSSIMDMLEWCALTRCSMIVQESHYSTYSMTASMWANIPFHNITEICKNQAGCRLNLWKPCLRLFRCGHEYNHVIKNKQLAIFSQAAPVLSMNMMIYSFYKVICLTKNEYDLIEDFLTFYGALVGFENIILIDNGSSHPSIPPIYEKFLKKGVTIRNDHRKMKSQSNIMTDCMRSLVNACEFMLPLDTDEFIYMTDGSALSPASLVKSLQDVPRVFTGVFYRKILDSVVDPSDPSYINFAHKSPVRSMTKFKESTIQKVIVRSSALNFIVMGNHEVNTLYGYRMISPSLGLLHYHNTGPARKYERTLQTITELGYIKPNFNDLPRFLADCRAHSESVGGHAYVLFVSFLVRLICISIWMDIHNRLPTLSEIKRVDDLKNEPDVVDHVFRLARSCETELVDESSMENTYSVVFGHWPAETWDTEIDQVSKFMHSLS